MPDTVADLAAQGAALAPDERVRLIDLLLASLHEQPLDGVQSAWDEEVERRLRAHDLGHAVSVDGEEVLAEARRLAR